MLFLRRGAQLAARHSQKETRKMDRLRKEAYRGEALAGMQKTREFSSSTSTFFKRTDPAQGVILQNAAARQVEAMTKHRQSHLKRGYQRMDIHAVDPRGRTMPYGVPVVISEDEAPKRIVYFGGASGCIAAILRYLESIEFYKNTRLDLYVADNWTAKINDGMDQPWGQDIASLAPHMRAKVKEMYPDRAESDRLTCKEYGLALEVYFKDLKAMLHRKGYNVEIIEGVDFSKTGCRVEYGSDEGSYDPTVRVEMGEISKTFPARDTLVINNAHSYGRLVTGNHDLNDDEEQPLRFIQGTELFSTPSDKHQDTIACVGFGLTYLWAASSLQKDGVDLICLYDKRYSPITTVADLIEANSANEWIRELPQSVVDNLKVVAIQDCKIKMNANDEYEVILPSGEVKNVGNKIFDLTGYNYTAEVTQDLPDEMMYRPSEAGVFSFPSDKVRSEIDGILKEAAKLGKDDKENFSKLMKMVEHSVLIKERLRPKNKTLSFTEFKLLQDELRKNHEEMQKFVRSKGGAVLELFNRYEQDALQLSHLQHVPQGSAPATYALAAHQFGHIPNLSLFEAHLIRSSHIFQAIVNQFQQETGFELTTELYEQYIKNLESQAEYSNVAIERLDLESRIKVFKDTIANVYSDIDPDKLQKFCDTQESYYKNAEERSVLQIRDVGAELFADNPVLSGLARIVMDDQSRKQNRLLE